MTERRTGTDLDNAMHNAAHAAGGDGEQGAWKGYEERPAHRPIMTKDRPAKRKPQTGASQPPPDEIREGAGLWGGRLMVFETLPSTNLWTLRNIAALDRGDVVAASWQTAGRGRMDRVWISPAGACVTLSAVLTERDAASPALLGQASALAVHATLAKHGIPATVKWPNDVLVNGRKIAGILAETADGPRVVLGIGLNVNQEARALDALPLLQPATSMRAATGQAFAIETVRATLLAELAVLLPLARTDARELARRWAACDALCGRLIRIATHDRVREGHCRGMDEEGRLLLLDAEGVTHAFWTGDVTMCRNL